MTNNDSTTTTNTERALAAFDDQTPPRYLRTNTTHPDFNRALWEKIRRWQSTAEAPWLGVIGPSGACKTRCGILAVRNLIERHQPHNERPLTTCFVTSYDLASAIRNQHSGAVIGMKPGGGEGYLRECDVSKKLLGKIRDADILLIDDLGKARATPAATAGLFEIIDYRHAHDLPMVWTSNLGVEGIVAGMPPDIGEPLGGRLIECSCIIRA